MNCILPKNSLFFLWKRLFLVEFSDYHNQMAVVTSMNNMIYSEENCAMI